MPSSIKRVAVLGVGAMGSAIADAPTPVLS